jgi:hypothetical protein
LTSRFYSKVGIGIWKTLFEDLRKREEIGFETLIPKEESSADRICKLTQLKGLGIELAVASAGIFMTGMLAGKTWNFFTTNAPNSRIKPNQKGKVRSGKEAQNNLTSY